MRRTALLITAMAVVILLTGGVALAKNIKCPNRDRNLCVGTNNNDTMTGRNRADIIKTRGGHDTVMARGGNDRVFGQDGSDVLLGELGNDKLDGGPNLAGFDFVSGGPGDDMLVESSGQDHYGFEPGWGQDQITGDAAALPLSANDALCFACGSGIVTTPLTINLATGTATDGTNNVTWDAATEPFIENVTGGSAGDTITGSGRPNVVSGFDGADNISVVDGNGSDFVNCGDSDGATDTVTKDAGDSTHANCASDTITTVGP